MNPDLTDQVLAAAAAHPDITNAVLSATGETVEITVDEQVFPLPLKRLAARLAELTTAHERDAYLRRAVVATVETARSRAESWDSARLLAARPMLFSASKFVTLGDAASGAEVVPGVVQAAVLDRETTISHIPTATLHQWGIGVEDALAAAHENLALAPTAPSWKAVPEAQHVHELAPVDDYVANLAFNASWWTRSQLPGTGPIFFVVPDRYTVIAGRVHRIEPQLATIADRILQAWAASIDPVSPVLYTVTGDQIEPLLVKPARARVALRRNITAFAEAGYRSQDRHVVPPDGSTYTAYVIRQSPAGEPFGYTSWDGHTLNQLLPRADYVELPDRQLTWPDFLSQAGNAVDQVPGAVPARWRTCRSLAP